MKYQCDWCKKEKDGKPAHHHAKKPVCKLCHKTFLIVDYPYSKICGVCNSEFQAYGDDKWCSYNCASGG